MGLARGDRVPHGTPLVVLPLPLLHVRRLRDWSSAMTRGSETFDVESRCYMWSMVLHYLWGTRERRTLNNREGEGSPGLCRAPLRTSRFTPFFRRSCSLVGVEEVESWTSGTTGECSTTERDPLLRKIKQPAKERQADDV